MTRRISLIIAILAILVPCMAHADEVSLDDFAYGVELRTDGNAPFYRMPLPPYVYQSVTDRSLRDMSVLNSDGETVMFTLERPAAKEREPEVVSVPFYPLPAHWDASKGTDGIELEVIRDENGSVVRVASRPGAPAPKANPASYLVDASALKSPVEKLRLTWEEPEDGFMSRALVERSDDLKSWTQTQPRDTVADLTYGSHRFVETDVQTGNSKARFYRISFPGQSPPPSFTAISAVLYAKQESQRRDEFQVHAVRKDNNGRVEYEFDSLGHRPVDRIEVLLPEPNSMADAVIFSRESADEPWRERARTQVYRFVQGEGELSSPAIKLAPVSDRYWMMRIPKDGGGGIGGGTPRMRFMWLPHELRFLARGRTPYTLAYGSAQLSAEQLASTGYLPNLKIGGLGLDESVEVKPSEAFPARQVSLAGPDVLVRLEPAPDWKRYILWGVLFFGVAILGWMAVSLARRIETHGEDRQS